MVRDAGIDRQSLQRSSNENRVFLNVTYHLDNTSITTLARDVTCPIKKYLLFCKTYDHKTW